MKNSPWILDATIGLCEFDLVEMMLTTFRTHIVVCIRPNEGSARVDTHVVDERLHSTKVGKDCLDTVKGRNIRVRITLDYSLTNMHIGILR
jgi:hypothetical protein